MKFQRRKFLYLAASAVTLPAASRIARAQTPSAPIVVSPTSLGVTATPVRPMLAPAMRDLVAGRSDWLPMIKAINNKEK
jgi:hypothetical protein